MDLIVVIAIIALLLLLLLPAVQDARAASRRSGCLSNLRQIGIGLDSYATTHRVLVPAQTHDMAWSYLVAILPFVGQQNVYQQVDFSLHYEESKVHSIRLPQYACPADPEVATGLFGKSNYCGNYSSDYITKKFDGYFRSHRLDSYGEQTGPLRVANIRDGLSQTVAVAEWLVGDDGRVGLHRGSWQFSTVRSTGDFQQRCQTEPPVYVTTPQGVSTGYFSGEFQSRGKWVAGQCSQTLYNHAITPNKHSCLSGGSVVLGIYSLSSLHAGGVNVLFADGHTQFIGDSIDLDLWRALGSRDGREVISQF